MDAEYYAKHEKELLGKIDEMLVKMKEDGHNVIEFRKATSDEIKLDIDRPLYYLKVERNGKVLKYAGEIGDVAEFIRIGLKASEAEKMIESLMAALGVKDMGNGLHVVSMVDCSKCPAEECKDRKKPFEQGLPSEHNPRMN